MRSGRAETRVTEEAVWTSTHRELLRDRIKQYVQTHLRDPDLSIHRIALALNCTEFDGDGGNFATTVGARKLIEIRKRHLHGVFEQELFVFIANKV